MHDTHDSRGDGAGRRAATSRAYEDASRSAVSGLRRVLVATDFSTHAQRAARRAAMLPLASDARVHLVHVVASRRDGEAARAKEMLEVERAKLEQRSGRPAAARVVAGEAWIEIIRAARACAADLVVLGAHSKRSHVFALGSTVERIVRSASSPVLVVRSAPARAYERPVVALDLSDVSRIVLETGVLVVGSDTPLRVVHAYHVPFEGFVATSSSRSELDAFRRQYREDARMRVRSFVASLGDFPARGMTAVRQGDPAMVIAHEIAARSADLVVLGTHGRTGLAHLLLGSVAEWTLRNAPCDVLVAVPSA